MKIVETTSPGERGDTGHIEIELTTELGKTSCSFGEGEPEDMTLNRDLSDAFNISDMLIMAYEAGKRGEELEHEFIDESDDE